MSITDHLVHGEDDAGAGALVTELLSEAGFVVDGSVTVPSEAVDIRTALNTGVIGGVDLIVTVGGVGVSPTGRDAGCHRRGHRPGVARHRPGAALVGNGRRGDRRRSCPAGLVGCLGPDPDRERRQLPRRRSATAWPR